MMDSVEGTTILTITAFVLAFYCIPSSSFRRLDARSIDILRRSAASVA